MKYKSLIIKTFLSVTAIIAAVGLLFFVYDRQKRYDMAEKSFIAMDTVVTEKIYADNYSETYIKAVIDIVTGLEDKISRFDENSQVYKLNSGSGSSDAALWSVISSVKDICVKTQGRFDITVGALCDLWDIGGENQKVPGEKEIEKIIRNVDYTAIESDGKAVYLNGKGQLDLGAVGKGYACDLIKAYISSADIKGAVVSVGGSILAYGDYNKKGDKWNVAVRHPRNEDEFLGILKLDEGFVSTSGDYERYFEEGGKRYHHIFDAATGYPASSGLISVTVVADSGVLSDALSTACFILGEEKGIQLLEEYEASGIFVDENLNITTVGDIDFEKQ